MIKRRISFTKLTGKVIELVAYQDGTGKWKIYNQKEDTEWQWNYNSFDEIVDFFKDLLNRCRILGYHICDPEESLCERNLIAIDKSYGTIIMLLFKHKVSGKWSFINLSKEYICECKFNSYKDAIDDLNKNKESGKIKSWRFIKSVTIRESNKFLE